MVVTIEKAAGSCMSAFQYNERKVSKGSAEVVAYSNLDSLEKEDIKSTFEKYENWSKRAVNLCFHASVNPSEMDNCSEEQVLAFIGDMMKELGYEKQPYVVYRHHDIDRRHYHIVSVRSDAEGNRIDAWYERKRLNQFMRAKSQEYGYEVGRGAVQNSDSLSADENESIARRHRPKRFNPSGSVISQLEEILDWALSYNFTNVHQLSLILDYYGVEMKEVLENGTSEYCFQGTDADGKAVTGMIHSDDAVADFRDRLSEALDGGVKTHQLRHREKTRVENLVRSCFYYSHSQKHLENMLEKNGVKMHPSYSESGEIIGITFVDHVTRTVFKASELHKVLTPAMMKDALESGKWRAHDKGETKKSSYVKASRQSASLMREVMASAAVNLGKGGSGSAGSVGKEDNEDKIKAINQAKVEANIAVSNVAVSNVAAR